MSIRTTVAVCAAAAVAAGSVALAAPTVAHGKFDAENARRLDGRQASQLDVVRYWNIGKDLPDFTGCHYQSVLTRTFRAPAKGTLSVTAVVSEETLFFTMVGTTLDARVTVDGHQVSLPSEIRTEPEDEADRGTITVLAGREVSPGRHTVRVQLRECSPDGKGAAFVTARSAIAQFSAFGSAEKVHDPRDVARGDAQR
jgi:hypothetical protein